MVNLYIFFLCVARPSVQISTAGSASCTRGSVGGAAQQDTTLLMGTPACSAQTTVSFATVHTFAYGAWVATL